MTVHIGDCREVLKTLEHSSVCSIVTDPPYEIGFMGKKWDSSGIAYDVSMWREALRVLKPGGYLLAFGGARTYHRMVCAIEDAGFEIRDQIMWLYGSGFPKSMNVAKAIQSGGGRPEDIRRMQMGDDYEPSGRGRANYDHGGGSVMNGGSGPVELSPEAAEWLGWGTGLKPAHEPIVVARKPLIGTVAENVLQHGTGALNIDSCRIPTRDNLNGGAYSDTGGREPLIGDERTGAALGMFQPGKTAERAFVQPIGRWPANVVHDGSDEVLAAFPDAPGQLADASTNSQSRKTQNVYRAMRRGRGDEPSANSDNDGTVGFHMKPGMRRLDTGSAARFFYCAKASKRERANSKHPTIKPLALIRYLVRLVTPPGGVVWICSLVVALMLRRAFLRGFGMSRLKRTRPISRISSIEFSARYSKRSVVSRFARRPLRCLMLGKWG